MSLTRLKWATILMPVVFIGCVEFLTAAYLEEGFGYVPSRIIQLAAIGIVGLMFSVVLFGAFERIQQRVERHNAELSALNAVGHAVSATQNLEAALASALGSVMSVTGATAAEIIVDDDSGSLERRTVSVGPVDQLARLKDAFPGGRAGSASPQGEMRPSSRIVSIAAYPQFAGAPPAAQATCSEVPLVAQDVHVGSLRLLALPDANWRSGSAERLLAAVGSQLAVAIRAGNLFSDVRQRGEEAEALFEIGLKLASLQDTQQVLESVVEHASRALGADSAAVCLSGSQSCELDPAHGSDRVEALGARSTEKRLHYGWVAWIDEGVTGQGDDCRQCPALAAPNRGRRLAAPLRSGPLVIGHLCVTSSRSREFTRRNRELLEGFADMAAIAVNNGRLLDRERQLAVLEERERLSREMHDSLAQDLGYLHLKVETMRRSLATDGLGGVSEGLEEISGVAQEAYQDVREAILGLRETLSEDESLMGALREYAQKFGRQSGIVTEIELEGEAPRLRPASEVQLVRVIQEALTNVRKHSHARRAVIRIAQHDAEIVISVEDDGRGFNSAVAHSHGQHFGLRTMRERVEGVGGRFAIESVPGQGTRVCIWFNRAEGEHHGPNTDPARRRPDLVQERAPSLARGRAGHDRGGRSG